jgi:hypothetical protein
MFLPPFVAFLSDEFYVEYIGVKLRINSERFEPLRLYKIARA